MPFAVQKDDKTLNYSDKEILNLLYSKILDKKDLNDEEFQSVLNLYLDSIGTEIKNYSLTQLTELSFSLGYYFRIFKDKNSVTFIKDENV